MGLNQVLNTCPNTCSLTSRSIFTTAESLNSTFNDRKFSLNIADPETIFTDETTQYGFTPTLPADFSDISSHMDIALVAHDGKTAEMVLFLMEHISLLKAQNIRLIATGTTARFVERDGHHIETE